MIAHGSRFDSPRPAGDGGNPQPTFVHAALVPREGTTALEETEGLSALIRWPVVTAEKDEGVPGEVQFLQEVQDHAHAAVHPRNHPGIGGVGMALPTITPRVLAAVTGVLSSAGVAHSFNPRFLGPPELPVGRDRFFGNGEFRVRNAERHVEEEGMLPVPAHPPQSLLDQLVMTVAARPLPVFSIDPQIVVFREEDLLSVAPEEFRIIKMGKTLVIETKEMIETLPVGAPRMTRPAHQAPLTHHAGPVTSPLQQHGNRDIAGLQASPVSSYRGVPHVHSGHEGAPGG